MSQNILIIDDNPLHRELIKINIMSELPHLKIFEGNNPKEAFGLLRNNEFDLILVDYNMPGMNGLEFLEKIENTKKKTPVIMITGEGSEEVATKAFKLGVTDYIIKTIDLPLRITKIVKETLSNPKRKEQMSANLNTVEGGIRLVKQFQRNIESKFKGDHIEEEIIIEFDNVSDFNEFSKWVTEQKNVKIKKIGFVGTKYAVLLIISPLSESRIV